MPTSAILETGLNCAYIMGLAVIDLGDDAIFDVDVEAVFVKVLGDHHAGLDDASQLGKLPFAKVLI